MGFKSFIRKSSIVSDLVAVALLGVTLVGGYYVVTHTNVLKNLNVGPTEHSISNDVATLHQYGVDGEVYYKIGDDGKVKLQTSEYSTVDVSKYKNDLIKELQDVKTEEDLEQLITKIEQRIAELSSKENPTAEDVGELRQLESKKVVLEALKNKEIQSNDVSKIVATIHNVVDLDGSITDIIVKETDKPNEYEVILTANGEKHDIKLNEYGWGMIKKYENGDDKRYLYLKRFGEQFFIVKITTNRYSKDHKIIFNAYNIFFTNGKEYLKSGYIHDYTLKPFETVKIDKDKNIFIVASKIESGTILKSTYNFINGTLVEPIVLKPTDVKIVYERLDIKDNKPMNNVKVKIVFTKPVDLKIKVNTEESGEVEKDKENPFLNLLGPVYYLAKIIIKTSEAIKSTSEYTIHFEPGDYIETEISNNIRIPDRFFYHQNFAYWDKDWYGEQYKYGTKDNELYCIWKNANDFVCLEKEE